VRGITNGSVTEGQIAALAMAVYFNDMNMDERVAFTLAMRDSGQVMEWKSLNLPGPVVDKHSTGGVGDVVSLMLGPMIAACGGFVPMISGRGLGHTGGTLDKFDSIPGYSTVPDPELFRKIVKEVGVAIIGQTAQLAPADKRFYSIRDTTATVESVAMITGSILSKKLSAGLDALVMDVKVGSGAFMPTYDKSVELAESIVKVGNGAGTRTSAILTDMNESLARAGNALEVRVAIDYLTGKARPARLHEVTMALCAEMLVLGPGRERNRSARQAAGGARFGRSGRALRAHGRRAGRPGRPDGQAGRLPGGADHRAGAGAAGRLRRSDRHPRPRPGGGALGGGRVRPQDAIDFAVGLTGLVELGDKIEAGQPLAMVHARTQEAAEQAVREVQAAYQIGAAEAAANDPRSSTAPPFAAIHPSIPACAGTTETHEIRKTDRRSPRRARTGLHAVLELQGRRRAGMQGRPHLPRL
jgi:thymidine phosphorylase